MSKGGKMTRLKSVLKKMQSFSKLGRSNSNAAIAASNNSSDDDNDDYIVSDNLHPVYVGKSRRRYLVSSDVIQHPLFRELVDRSSTHDHQYNIVVSCEVVLFEHLLWMLDNSNSSNDDHPPESLEELVEFYACS